MPDAKQKSRDKPSTAGDERRNSNEPGKKPSPVNPVEGAQTASEGLGYLKKPEDDVDKGKGPRRGK